MRSDPVAARAAVEKLLVLSHRPRLAILWALIDGGLRQRDLERRVHMGAKSLTGHLRALGEAGFIRALGRGHQVLYKLALPVLVGSGGKVLDLGWCKIAFGEGVRAATRASNGLLE